MRQLLPILVGLALLFAGGLIHGRWTDRWHSSTELAEAGDRLLRLPNDIGEWKGHAYDQDQAMLTLSGAVGHYSRSFRDPQTGEQVLVIILAGKPARMVVHRPEHCYQSAGYELTGSPFPVQIQVNGQKAALTTAQFTRNEPSGPSQMRIFWTFGASGQWQTSENPRWEFARQEVLYKMYILRDIVSRPGPLNQDPCIRLLKELLPVVNTTLFGA